MRRPLCFSQLKRSSLYLAIALLTIFREAPADPPELQPQPAPEAAAQTKDAAAIKDPQIEKLLRQISADRIESTIKTLAAFQTRHTLSEANDPNLGIGAARNWLKAELTRYAQASGGRLQVEFDRFVQPETPPRIFRAVEIVNVVATLPGRQPEAKDRIYVVSAHYDSRSSAVNDTESFAPGANDDASGTAAVLELARVLSQHEFDATLVFLLVAAEEQGLQGSHHWVENAKARGLRIAGMLNNDIIGSSIAQDGTVAANVVRLFADGVPSQKTLPEDVFTQLKTGGENDFAPRQLARAVKSAAEIYLPAFTVRIVYRRDRYLRSGDHSSFLDAGYPAVRLTEPAENFTHQHQDVEVEDGVQYGDLPEYVDFNYVADVARVNAAALATLAEAPAPPSEVEVETAHLENDTHLRWRANTEPDLAGYRIVWRDTTSAFWEHSVDVGNVTEFQLKGLSKDNLVFGLQALDTSGHVSPAVYPLPARSR